MTGPEVSVLIPTRNRRELLLRRSLRSALLQEGVEHEVIVIDDGSTDDTPAHLEALHETRVRVIRRDVAGGAAAARNDGIDAARGEWIAFLDDDDAWAPHKLRVQLDAVRSAGADFAYAAVVTVDDRGHALYTSAPPAAERLAADTIAMSGIPAGSSNILVRTELVRRLGGFDEQLVNLEDWDLWIRLASAGVAVAAPEILVACLEHRGGKALTTPSRMFAQLDYLERKHDALWKGHGVEFDRVAFTHYVAWLQLRRHRRASAARLYLGSAIRHRRPQDALLAARFGVRALIPVRRTLRSAGDREYVPELTWLGLYR
jgi:glycosyltransferase involved in cell wall biosynthesis